MLTTLKCLDNLFLKWYDINITKNLKNLFDDSREQLSKTPVRLRPAPPRKVMEKIAGYVGLLTVTGLVIAYGILYFGYNFG